MVLSNWDKMSFIESSVSSIIKKNGGIEHLEAGQWAHIYIASLYYYPVLCEHGKKGVPHLPPSPFGGNTGEGVLRFL